MHPFSENINKSRENVAAETMNDELTFKHHHFQGSNHSICMDQTDNFQKRYVPTFINTSR